MRWSTPSRIAWATVYAVSCRTAFRGVSQKCRERPPLHETAHAAAGMSRSLPASWTALTTRRPRSPRMSAWAVATGVSRSPKSTSSARLVAMRPPPRRLVSLTPNVAAPYRCAARSESSSARSFRVTHASGVSMMYGRRTRANRSANCRMTVTVTAAGSDTEPCLLHPQ